MDLERLQREVGMWADQQFGDQPPSYALVGAAEEVGELSEAYLSTYMQNPDSPGVEDQIHLALELQAAAGMLLHSILKRTQGIRLDEEGVGPGAEQEAGERIRYILDDLAEQRTRDYTGRNVHPDAIPEPSEEMIDAVADTHIYFGDFCHRAGIDLNGAVTKTWDEIVSQREWDSQIGEDVGMDFGDDR